LWNSGLGEKDFDAAGGFLVIAKQRSTGVEASGDDAAVVEHQKITGVEQRWKIGEVCILQCACRTIHH